MNVARLSPRRDRSSARRPSALWRVVTDRLCQDRLPWPLRFPLRLALAGAVAAASFAIELPPLQGAEWQGTPWATYGRDHEAVCRRPGPVFRTLDAVAGGIERLFHLDRQQHACDELQCDDACDTATLRALELQPGEVIHLDRSPQAPAPDRQAPDRQRLEPLPPPGSPSNRRRQENRTRPETQEDGSIFDALSDPFEDDAASLRRRPGGSGGSREHRKMRPISETTAPLMRLDPPVRQTTGASSRRTAAHVR